ncbi:MAG: DUF6084 family protein [Candidatus Dormibacteria bacterium]
MPDLAFSVDSVAAVDGALTPELAFSLGVTDRAAGSVDTIVLQTQLMIEAVRRPYEPREREALLDLFGTPERWGTTLKRMLWTHAQTVVPGFEGSTRFILPVPSTFDLSLAAAKYFFALEQGDVPLTFQFSGTVFYRTPGGDLMTERIPWSAEAEFRLPVSTWRDLINRHYPDGAWLCLQSDVFERLYRYKARRQVPTWESVIDELLDKVSEAAAT